MLYKVLPPPNLVTVTLHYFLRNDHKFITSIRNGHSPTNTSVRLGVTTMQRQRPWPLAKGDGFICAPASKGEGGKKAGGNGNARCGFLLGPINSALSPLPTWPVAGLGLFDQKNAIAATTPIATAFKFCVRHRKMGSWIVSRKKLVFRFLNRFLYREVTSPQPA